MLNIPLLFHSYLFICIFLGDICVVGPGCKGVLVHDARCLFIKFVKEFPGSILHSLTAGHRGQGQKQEPASTHDHSLVPPTLTLLFSPCTLFIEDSSFALPFDQCYNPNDAQSVWMQMGWFQERVLMDVAQHIFFLYDQIYRKVLFEWNFDFHCAIIANE